jgi:hypothetical protein
MNAVNSSGIAASLSDIQLFSDIISDTKCPLMKPGAGNGTLHEISGYSVEAETVICAPIPLRIRLMWFS